MREKESRCSRSTGAAAGEVQNREREKIVFELEGEGRQSQQQRGSISSREGAVEGGETTREIVRVWQKQDFFF